MQCESVALSWTKSVIEVLGSGTSYEVAVV